MNKELLQCLLKYDMIDQKTLNDLAKLEKMIDESETFESQIEIHNDLCKAKSRAITEMGYNIYDEITE